MGSAVSKQSDPARDLLMDLRALVRAVGPEPNLERMVSLLADALHEPSQYEALLLGLCKYLRSTLRGSSPNLDRWHGR